MTSRATLLLSLALFLSCAPAVTRLDAPAAPRANALAAAGTARRVVLISFDGLGADALARQKHLASFDRLAREGASARVITVNPTLTAPTHTSILTGVDPQRHGVVSNRLRTPGLPRGQVVRGHVTDPDVETLVEAARRQGKRVGVVPFPTLDNTSPRRTADFGLAWSAPVVPARLARVTRADFRREWVPPTWTSRPQRRVSFSPIMRARLEWSIPSAPVDVDVVAYDTSDDRAQNYDTYFVEVGERETPAGEWFAVSARPRDGGMHGSWSRIIHASPSLDVTIYWGAISRNNAWPQSFRDLLDEHAGFFPGVPEEELEIDPSLFVDQVERLARFCTRVQTLAIERVEFDLLLAYQPQIDQAAHEFLGTAHGERTIGAAFASADRAVAAIAEALEPEDALVVTGDHGLIPERRPVHVNRLLAERGFAPRWQAAASGAVAHIYRYEGPDDSDALVDMLTSSGLFERVEKKTPAMHRNSGDVIATGFPDVAVIADDAPWHPGGGHGALNTHRELHTVLFAYGRGVRPGPYGEVAQTQIATFVAGLLGLKWSGGL